MPEFYGDGGYGLGLYDFPDNPVVFDAVTEYYIGLLIMQYINKTKARQTVGVFVQENVASQIIKQVQDGFDLDTAFGAQLDILGTYRGLTRNVYGLDVTRTYFSTPSYDDAYPFAGTTGFSEYDDATVTAYWVSYDDFDRPAYSMTDDEFRRLIQFVAKVQASDHSVKAADDILYEFFADKVSLSDNGDMTITYTHDVGDPDTLFGIVNQTGNLPQPAGVTVVVI